MHTFIVDSFTEKPFKGNPAGVCFPEQDISEGHMQHIASELGMSETAFVRPNGNAGTYHIRYFSPKMEIPLCGHATLASAKVLFQNKDVNEIHFITIQNLNLRIRRQEDEVTMEFPVYDTIAKEAPALLVGALGLDEVKNSVYNAEHNILLLEIADSDVLANLNPVQNVLVNSHSGINGVLVTAASRDQKYDYHYRYFWPWAGTDEDPVTGGVQTFLGKYWSKRLDKKTMNAFQSSLRTGHMKVEVSEKNVTLTSQAVIILEGNLFPEN